MEDFIFLREHKAAVHTSYDSKVFIFQLCIIDCSFAFLIFVLLRKGEPASDIYPAQHSNL